MTTQVEKTVFLRHLYIKIIILPRQARDKHRENSKKETVLLQIASIMQKQSELMDRNKKTERLLEQLLEKLS